jgi:hypothetical protein
MKGLLSLIIFLTLASYVYSAPGDTIRTIATGNYSVRGLAFDPSDKGIWIAANLGPNNVQFCKLNNDLSNYIQNWKTLQGMYWVFDIAYPYAYSGIDCIAVIDQNSPRIRLFKPSTGENVYNYAQDPYSGGIDSGIDVNYNKSYMYATNYNFTSLMMWNGGSWNPWVTMTASPAMGVAYGWSRVFVIFSTPSYSISVYRDNGDNGVFETSYSLKSWNSYMVGISRGRDNIVGSDESLYVACFYPSNAIKEVEIGQFNQTGIETASIGDIKALFH